MVARNITDPEVARRVSDATGDIVLSASRLPVDELAMPNAIIGSALGAANNHPDYEAAKGGDLEAGLRVASDLVTLQLLQEIRAAIGNSRPVVQPVVSIEASGRNKIPAAAAAVIAGALDLSVGDEIIQSNSPRRTGLDGLDRIFAPVEFDGSVEPADYLLVDDTLTQGGTFAALASHIQANGGRVAGVIALTGKRYSAKIRPEPAALNRLRQKHGDLEDQFRAAAGYGFDALTQSEARYLLNFEPAQQVRDRIAEAGAQARRGPAAAEDREQQDSLIRSVPRPAFFFYSQLQRAIE